MSAALRGPDLPFDLLALLALRDHRLFSARPAPMIEFGLWQGHLDPAISRPCRHEAGDRRSRTPCAAQPAPDIEGLEQGPAGRRTDLAFHITTVIKYALPELKSGKRALCQR